MVKARSSLSSSSSSSSGLSFDDWLSVERNAFPLCFFSPLSPDLTSSASPASTPLRRNPFVFHSFSPLYASPFFSHSMLPDASCILQWRPSCLSPPPPATLVSLKEGAPKQGAEREGERERESRRSVWAENFNRLLSFSLLDLTVNPSFPPTHSLPSSVRHPSTSLPAAHPYPHPPPPCLKASPCVTDDVSSGRSAAVPTAIPHLQKKTVFNK